MMNSQQSLIMDLCDPAWPVCWLTSRTAWRHLCCRPKPGRISP